jgi:hypothetical protein
MGQAGFGLGFGLHPELLREGIAKAYILEIILPATNHVQDRCHRNVEVTPGTTDR